jgi:hypothetical protein
VTVALLVVGAALAVTAKPKPNEQALISTTLDK